MNRRIGRVLVDVVRSRVAVTANVGVLSDAAWRGGLLARPLSSALVDPWAVERTALWVPDVHSGFPSSSQGLPSAAHNSTACLPFIPVRTTPPGSVPWSPLVPSSRHFHSHMPLLYAPLRQPEDSKLQQQQQQQQVGPEDTDRIVAELRYRNIAVPKTLDVSWQRRFENWAKSIMSAARGTVKFIQSIPPAVSAMARMTGPEWRTTLAGWWVTIKHEAHHYWVGFRLFGFELRVASRLVWKQLQGHTLTRRERKQLTRTTADIFRMVPFSLFIIIPFAELLLPVALRLFPNMLPSTFQNQLKEEENLKKRLVVKMELARFLQETVGELAKDLKHSRTGQAADDARELYDLLKKVREGQPVSNESIMRFAKLFNDEITLDNMDRVHLVTLCEFLGLTQIGTNEFLRMRLRTYLNDLKTDDMMIQHEGLDAMMEDELRQACRARGMSAPFGEGSRSILQQHMQDWLDLSLNRNVPPSLLLMSRAFKLTSQPQTPAHKEDVTAQSLRETIGLLQEDTISDLEMETFVDARSSPSKRLEYLKREEADLKREEEEEREQEREAEAARVRMELSQRQLDMVEARARATAKAVMLEAAAGVLQRAVDEGTATIEAQSSDEQMYKVAAEKQRKMKKVIDALAMLASASGVSKERAIFMEVAKEEVGGMLDRFATKGGSQMYFDMLGLNVVRPPLESKEAAVTQQVSDYVSNILIRIEQDIDAVDSKIGEKLHLLDKDNDGIITRAELQEAIAFVKEELGQDELDSLLQLLGNDESFSIKDLEVKIAANSNL